jgi:membrane protein DedA with SNARE-associated domain
VELCGELRDRARDAGAVDVEIAIGAGENAAMSLPQLLADYGYLAVFAGSLLEGETIVVLAGFAAQQGYMSPQWIVALAFCGGTMGDQFYFFLGRRFGDALLLRSPHLVGPAERVSRLLLRYHEGLIVSMRFMYGLRVLGAIAIGMSALPAWRFVLFNAIGAAIWALAFTTLGFMFGHFMQTLLMEIERYKALALALIIGFALVAGLMQRLRASDKR